MIAPTAGPALADEALHPGAARLDVDTDKWRLKGEYWTRRSWRSGFNTAGILEVKRVSR